MDRERRRFSVVNYDRDATWKHGLVGRGKPGGRGAMGNAYHSG